MGLQRTDRQQRRERQHPIDQHLRVHLIGQHLRLRVHLIGHLHLDRWVRHVLLLVQVAQAQVGQLQAEAEEVEEDINFFEPII